MNDHKINDEIDLQDLLIQVIRFVRQRFWAMMLSAITGGIVIGGISFILPKVYVSNMILSSDILTSSYAERITESIVNLIREQNYDEIAKRLRVTTKQAKAIQRIDIESIKQTAEKDKESATFIVTVEILDRSMLDTLQSGIIEFLRENEFVKVRVRQREFLYKEMINKTTVELKSLDSLKQRLFQGKAIYSKGAEMLLVDPTNIYTKIIDLNRQIIEYNNALELMNSIQLVEGFTAYQKPAKPSKFFLTLAGIFLGIFIYLGLMTTKWLLDKSKI